MWPRIVSLLIAVTFVCVGLPAFALVAKPKAKPAAEALREQELEFLRTLQTPNHSADELLEASKKLYRLRAGRELCTYAGDEPSKKAACEKKLLDIFSEDTPKGRNLISLCDSAAGKEAKNECHGKYDEISNDIVTMDDESDGISADARKMDRSPEQLKSFVAVNVAMKLKQMSEKFVHTGGSSSSPTNDGGQR